MLSQAFMYGQRIAMLNGDNNKKGTGQTLKKKDYTQNETVDGMCCY